MGEISINTQNIIDILPSNLNIRENFLTLLTLLYNLLKMKILYCEHIWKTCSQLPHHAHLREKNCFTFLEKKKVR